MADPVASALARLRRAPADPEAWSRLGEALLAAGAAADAIEALQKAATLQPTGARIFRLAAALQQLGQHQAALALYQQAVQTDPQLTAAWHNLGGLLAGGGALEAAEQAFEQVTTLDPRHARAWCNLGVVRRRRGRFAAACAALETAVELDSNYGLALANLAGAQEQANRPADARASAERALALSPGDAVSSLVLARLDRSEGDPEAALARLDALDAAALPADLQARRHGERAQALDRLQRPDEAFAAFAAANAARASTPEAAGVAVDGYPTLVRGFIQATPALLTHARTLPPPNDAPPVFLVGFPRSGTTLTERILVAHPALRGSDEVPLLEATLASVGRTPEDITTALLALDGPGRDGLRARYRAEAAARLDDAPGRLVDKLPLNLVFLGAIAVLFPDAPVVFVLRDPRDSALSCFMQDFVLNAAMVQMLDLARIVALQEQVLGLWRTHASALPNPTLTVRYEDIVADQPGAARALLEHLGLPWDDRVTRYWKGARDTHISTPSHQDVSKPIFTRARGRWRRYAEHLAPVRRRLDALATAFDYPAE